MGNASSSGYFKHMGSIVDSPGRGIDEIDNLQRKNFENKINILEQTCVSKNTTHSIP